MDLTIFIHSFIYYATVAGYKYDMIWPLMKFFCPQLILLIQHNNKEENKGIFPIVATHLKGRFFVFFTVTFLLFLAPAGGSNPAGPIA